MALNFFMKRVFAAHTMSMQNIDVITNEHPDIIRQQFKSEINNDSHIDLSFKDLESIEQVYEVYCKKCGKKEAAVKFGGGFKCIVCWTIRPGHYRTHLKRRKKWSK